MQNIILCGLQKSGKTTIGFRLAANLKRNFIDTDRMIEKAYCQKTGKKSICRQIYLDEGESTFRAYEREQITLLKEIRAHVISLGGGSLENLETRQLLQSLGTIIYLKSPIDVVWNRIQKRGVPSYLNQGFAEADFFAVAQKRMSIYESVANYIVDTSGLSKTQIVNAILNYIHSLAF